MDAIHTLAADSLAQYLREHHERIVDLVFQHEYVAGFVAANHAVLKGLDLTPADDVSPAYREGFAAALYRFGID